MIFLGCCKKITLVPSHYTEGHPFCSPSAHWIGRYVLTFIAESLQALEQQKKEKKKFQKRLLVLCRAAPYAFSSP